ncbi:uncharacterized protein LOC132203945 [Neocloeon triangulifer]|uniref:uncharacterized protein LOC132203945 n=1 Tax=Neocloeon triangulifer TaxID=2078957 RepID=UPI00286F552F|nr:uncharacterized protein LOC132203945 [Neocloeon triangulifer]
MEIGSWIWFFAVCTYFSSAQTRPQGWDERINLTDCWNHRRNRSIFEASGVQNFNDCGRWNKSGNPPWIVYLRTYDGEWDYGVLVSDKTIISEYGWPDEFITAQKEGKGIQIYAGECEDEDDAQKCFFQRGLLQNKKVLHVKKVELKHGGFYSKTINVLRIDKVDLRPNLQPACLWNWDNTNDEHETFYVVSDWHSEQKKLDFLTEQKCYKEEKIYKFECDLYGNSICTSRNAFSHYLLIERDQRFYLRAIEANSTNSTSTWVDLLPFFNQITSASVN